MPKSNRPFSSRVWRECRAGNLTHARMAVMFALAGYGPTAWPSHETLAERAACSVRTVQRALEDGRRLGLVTWVERRIRAGWRWLRTSNRYFITVPDTSVVPRAARPTTGQDGRGGDSEERKRLMNKWFGRPPLTYQPPIRTPAEQIAYCRGVNP